MKKLSILSLIVLVLASCSGKKQAQEEQVPEITPAQTLIARLQALQDSGLIAFGHHDDLAYGYRWEFVEDSSDVKNVVGDYPAIVNWDLGLIEHLSPEQLDGVPFDLIRKEARKHHERGGINTISWHPRNPVTGGNAWDVSDPQVIAKCLTDSALNDTLRTWIGRAADFIATLTDSEGNPIPVVFRPWHEQTGSWFWWGEGFRTPQEYKDLWILTHDIFDEKGLDNVVWAYSPDKSNCETIEQYMETYPGDEYVDIFGADVYHFGGEAGNEIFNQWMTNMLTFATQMAKEKGKIAALTETGSEACPLPNWYCEVLYPAIKDYPIAYITVWRNAMPERKPGHFYTPYKGHPSEQDFINFYNLPQTAFLNDLPK